MCKVKLYTWISIYSSSSSAKIMQNALQNSLVKDINLLSKFSYQFWAQTHHLPHEWQTRLPLSDPKEGIQTVREEVTSILSILRIGHTYFSHLFMKYREDPPEGIACQKAYSVKQVLIDCTDLDLMMSRFYHLTDMKTFFDTDIYKGSQYFQILYGMLLKLLF